jgi:hypothetical protein
MKKYFVIMISMLVIALSGFAIPVPKALSDAFAKKFPNATNVKWGKESAKEYEAEFKINGKSISANFLTDGTWVETEAEITGAEIPDMVANAVNTKHPGATLLKVYKIETAKGKTTYEAEIKSGNKKLELIINEDGKVIK